MSGIRDFLTDSNGIHATHLFMLNDANEDSDSDGDGVPQAIDVSGAGVSFTTTSGDKVCGGVDYCLETRTVASTAENGGIGVNQNDINLAVPGDYGVTKRSLCVWFKSTDVSYPTCVYEQGANVNNFAFTVGIGGNIAFQAADAGQPFLIAMSKEKAQANRAYFLVGVWKYRDSSHSNHNGILFYVNGVLQETVFLTGNEAFPNHSGDITFGNTDDGLKTYNESTMTLWAVEKQLNLLGMFNHQELTESQSREIFERTVIPDITIAAQSKADQQTALDALSGNSYSDFNCKIRIFHATDQTGNYRLFVDNVTFQRNDNLKDIAIQYVGSHQLTIENANGSNVYQTSAPTEVDTTNNSYTSGGGSVTVVNGTTRLKTAQSISDKSSTKLVVEATGTYNLTDCVFDTIENISGGNVTINLYGYSTISNTIGSGISIITKTKITVYVKDVESGSAIEGARVYITDGSTTLMNLLTDSNGKAEVNYDYTTDVSITGTTRKASSSPYYKPAEISGTINKSGFQLTVLLIKDE